MGNYDSLNYKGYEVEIFYDCTPQDPRTDWDHESVLFSNHQHINPDKSSIDELMERYDVDDLESLRERLDKDFIWVNVYKYEHSGIALSTTPFCDRWDSGLLGILAIEKDKVRRLRNCKRITKKVIEEEEKYLVGEVETYGAYLNGEVYGFQIFNNGKLIDSCSGYYGKSGLEQLKEDYEDVINSETEK